MPRGRSYLRVAVQTGACMAMDPGSRNALASAFAGHRQMRFQQNASAEGSVCRFVGREEVVVIVSEAGSLRKGRGTVAVTWDKRWDPFGPGRPTTLTSYPCSAVKAGRVRAWLELVSCL